LSNNTDRLPYREVTVPAEEVADLFAADPAVLSDEALPVRSARMSVVKDPFRALIDRRVEIQLAGSADEVVTGRLLEVSPVAWVVAADGDSGGVVVVPAASVLLVRTWQLTALEVEMVAGAV
jgi:hypothetical protein